MIDTLRSEWIKLRTLLVHWVLVVVAVAFPVVITVLVASFATLDDPFGPNFVSSDLASLVAGLAVVSAMLFGTISSISLTSEYAHNTIRPTYAATPKRSRVLAAKVTVNSAVGLVLAVFIVAVSWALGSVILNGRGAEISLGDDDVIASLASVVVLVVIVAWFGFGLGLIIRNSPATVTLLLLWPLLIENLIALVVVLVGWDGARDWLPYTAALQAVGSDDSADVDGLGRPWGLVYFAVVCSALVTFGTWLDHRRDA